MSDRFPFARGRSQAARLVARLSMLLLAVPTLAGAQSVVVPTFDVRGALAGRTTLTVDLAEGADGSILFVWDEHGKDPLTGRTGTMSAQSRVSPTGTALPTEPSVYGCCLRRPTTPRVAAYETGGYTRSVVIGDANDFFVMGPQLNALGAQLPGTDLQIDLATQAASVGRGLAVATLGASATHLLWDDATDMIIGRRLNEYPATSGTNLIVGASDPNPFIDVAAIPPNRMVAGWGSTTGALPHARGVVYDVISVPGPTITLSTDTVLRSLVVSPLGDRLALVGTRPAGTETPNEIWGRYFALDGTPLGADFPIYATAPGTAVAPDAAFDLSGDLYVVWNEGGTTLRAVGVDAAGTVSGPAATLATGAFGADAVRTIRLTDPLLQNTGSFMNAWSDGTRVRAQVASNCTAGSSTCGDGVRVPFCELCDDGAGNDDVAADACRTDCRPARCGDGVTDTGETCDDGNRDACDGCDASCQTEVALGCGNGLVLATCGEQCDDGNVGEGDGCSATCQNELVPGGGSVGSDCLVAWSVDNPSNTPRFAKDGTFNRRQACTDNDPACDHDGGVVGSCTFALRACANNTALTPCATAPRLATWKLEKPSAKDAAKSPAAAQVFAALTGSIPGALIGPLGTDFCSPTTAVVVPLNGAPGRYHVGKRSLRMTTKTYDGRKDGDKLDLRCAPLP